MGTIADYCSPIAASDVRSNFFALPQHMSFLSVLPLGLALFVIYTDQALSASLVEIGTLRSKKYQHQKI